MILSFKEWLLPKKDAETLMSLYSKSGKSELLQRLVELHADDLYHFLLSQSDSELAKDISQKTWLKVIDKREYYQNKGTFKAWLFTVGRNTLFDEFRKQNRYQDLFDDQTEADPLNQDTLDNDIQTRFKQVLENLPFKQREAFVLQQEGFSILQIAQITQEKEQTIKTRLRYAKSYFRQHIGG